MGAAYTTAQAVATLQNTSTWAFNKKTKERYASWKKVYAAETGLLDYKNRYGFYDSPYLHTVTLTGLNVFL